MKKDPITELGVLARQREIIVLQVIHKCVEEDTDYERAGREKGEVPFFEIQRHTDNIPVCRESQPANIPFLYTLYSVISDLVKYELVEAKWADGWSVTKITEKGKKLLESYES